MKLPYKLLVVSGVGLILAGCSSVGTQVTESPPASTSASAKPTVLPPYRGGGYYKDDGPGAHPPPNLASIPNAQPKWEPMNRYANNTYTVMGKTYHPDLTGKPYHERGQASWYGRRYNGRPTSSGEPYDMYAMTAAHRTLPIPSYARVTNLENGRSVVVRINDRGPFRADRIIDLSYAAAYKLDLLKGVGMVEVDSVTPDDQAEPGSFTQLAQTPPSDTVAPSPPATTKSEESAAPAEPAQANAIYLQMGAYANADKADALASQLIQRLGRDVPGMIRLQQDGFTKIQVGPYMDANTADKAAESLAQDLGVKPYRVVGKAWKANPAAVPTHTGKQDWLQVAAYTDAAKAEALYDRLKQRQDLPGVEKLESDGLIKIQAGPYADPDAADRAADLIAQTVGLKPYRISR